MSEKEPLPSKEGLKEAIKRFKTLREKKPSDELVKIIRDIAEENFPDKGKKDDIAADSPNRKHPESET